jgi:hypothetical protein
MNMRTKRMLLAIGALAALLPFGVASVDAAAVTSPATNAAAGFATPFDRAIDPYVQQSVAAGRLAAGDALVAREQLQIQFGTLTRAEQARILSAARSLDTLESVQAAVGALHAAAIAEARAAQDSMDTAGDPNARAQGLVPKLGGDGDSVFLSTVGPCRIYDTRNGPGQLPGTAARQIWALSILNGYNFAIDQGGTGVTGAGNCQPMAFFATRPVSVVAIVTVINPVTSGALQAWNGGTTLIVGGAVLAWNPGDRGSNTTVIPMDRSIAAYAGSGAKRDFGIYNNSGGPIDVIIDVVGYFIENNATALDCTEVFDAGNNVPANGSLFVNTPACPAGYANVTGLTSLGPGLYTSTLHRNGCRIGNLTGGALIGFCGISCCRVPGR